MLLPVPDVLTAQEIAQAQALLQSAPWVDGRVSAGPQAAQVKNNAQLPHDCKAASSLRSLVLHALDRQARVFSAALPKRVYTPGFNRYTSGGANFYGPHVDSALRYAPEGGQRVRTDLSCTLFLSDPQDYDGGELIIHDTHGDQHIKLPAGHLVLYPGTSVHQVAPVTRGTRLACFFWIESMVRSTEQRRLLFDMDNHLIHLRNTVGETDAAVVGLTATYHNLLRMWADS
jgi:PKHD-type hydroxylase